MNHNRAFLESDRDIYAAMGNAFTGVDEFKLPMGKTPYQGYSPRCAGEAIGNVAETCYHRHGAALFPAIKPIEIYRRAKKLDNHPDFRGGTDLSAAAEAYCELAATGIRWMEIPRDPQLFAAWMITERTGVALAMYWHMQDQYPGFARVMEKPPGAISTDAHAIHLFGWKRVHEWKRHWFDQRRKSPVLMVENSNWKHASKPGYLIPQRVQMSGIQAIVLIPPGYGK